MVNDQMDYDEVTTKQINEKSNERLIEITLVIKSRRSFDVPDGNVNSIERIIRIVSC